MASDNSDYRLLLTVRSDGLRVSHVSSTLRVIQAAVREVARGVDQSSHAVRGPVPNRFFSWTLQHPPTPALTMSFYFADSDDAPMRELSEQVLGAFMDEFARVLASRSQLGLWGRTARVSGPAGNWSPISPSGWTISKCCCAASEAYPSASANAP